MTDQEPQSPGVNLDATTIEQEVRKTLDRNLNCLDNLIEKMPGMFYRKLEEGVMDIRHDAQGGWEESRGFSQLFRSQTPREFFAVIDEACGEELPTIVDKCKEYRRLSFAQKNEDPVSRVEALFKVHEELIEMSIPAYVKLRLQGYSGTDLMT